MHIICKLKVGDSSNYNVAEVDTLTDISKSSDLGARTPSKAIGCSLCPLRGELTEEEGIRS